MSWLKKLHDFDLSEVETQTAKTIQAIQSAVETAIKNRDDGVVKKKSKREALLSLTKMKSKRFLLRIK